MKSNEVITKDWKSLWFRQRKIGDWLFSKDRKAIQQRGIVSCKADDVGKFCKLFC